MSWACVCRNSEGLQLGFAQCGNRSGPEKGGMCGCANLVHPNAMQKLVKWMGPGEALTGR